MVRSIAFGEPCSLIGILILLAYLTIFTVIGLYFVYQKKNL